MESGTSAAPGPTAAWRTWLAVGATGFGGPAGQVAILHREVVERRGWLTEDEFLAALRVCMLLPGPEAQQLATYAGWRIGGMGGGLLAGSLFVLPGALVVTALSWLHAAGRDLPPVAAAFAGVRPAVVALVMMAAWRIGRRSIRSPLLAAVAAAALLALARGIPFPAVVAVAALIGWLAITSPAAAAASAGHGADGYSTTPADERSPSAGLVRHAVLVAGVAVAIGGACYAIVRATAAAGGRGASIAGLFTETTLLSFGGAYAVVPWALDEAVARGWIDRGERFAAVALGEATPGPLILVVTFIGFLAGWKGAPEMPLAAGMEGAATATLFAFLPSFAMILAVAPAVRWIRAGSRLAGGLAAVGAPVVAAIVLLAARLSRDAFFTDSAGGMLDPVAVAIFLPAAAAVATTRVPTPVVVLAAAVIGALRGFL